MVNTRYPGGLHRSETLRSAVGYSKARTGRRNSYGAMAMSVALVKLRGILVGGDITAHQTLQSQSREITFIPLISSHLIYHGFYSNSSNDV